jgi:hypothetical protein
MKEKHMRKPIPEFQNEDEEREFWAQHNSTEYLDWDRAERVVLPKLKTTKTISPLSNDVERIETVGQ